LDLQQAILKIRAVLHIALSRTRAADKLIREKDRAKPAKTAAQRATNLATASDEYAVLWRDMPVF